MVSILLITLPILVVSLGVLQIDLTWSAIVMMINMELALITPPIGINLFVVGGMMQSIGQPAPQARIVAGVTPYFLIMITFLVALIVFPSIVTVPVGWFFG